MIYVVTAALVLPVLVPVGFYLTGNPEAELVAVIGICAAIPLQAVLAGLLLLMRFR